MRAAAAADENTRLDPLNRFGRAALLPPERAVGRAGDFYLEFCIPGGGGPYPTEA